MLRVLLRGRGSSARLLGGLAFGLEQCGACLVNPRPGSSVTGMRASRAGARIPAAVAATGEGIVRERRRDAKKNDPDSQAVLQAKCM
ncbi:hypothetical protein C1879_00655 [Paraeggerthella hongkongensis]|nr:hypothetical protein C1879_00655 [Paraeggerthella hongkongensis]